MRQLDDIDCVILERLQQCGDASNLELSRRIGLSPAATSRRVQQLRSDGVITGVHAAINHDKVGLKVEAFVLVALAEHSNASDARFAAALRSMPQVLRADHVSGTEDILLHIAAADTSALQQVLRALPRVGARRVTTLLLLENIKPPAPVPLRQSGGAGVRQ